jgi:polyisoprenoid-binding protein YceI
MANWSFEPGHTAAEFRARHMMVTYVRGHFKDVHGTLDFDPENPRNSSVEVKIDARNTWTGVKERDDHLRSAVFLDAEQHPEINLKGNQVEIRESMTMQ